jgi:hypothetical protein
MSRAANAGSRVTTQLIADSLHAGRRCAELQHLGDLELRFA